jgi:hypothetical protein
MMFFCFGAGQLDAWIDLDSNRYSYKISVGDVPVYAVLMTANSDFLIVKDIHQKIRMIPRSSITAIEYIQGRKPSEFEKLKDLWTTP